MVVADRVLATYKEVSIAKEPEKSSKPNDREADHAEPSESGESPGLVTDLIHPDCTTQKRCDAQNKI